MVLEGGLWVIWGQRNMLTLGEAFTGNLNLGGLLLHLLYLTICSEWVAGMEVQQQWCKYSSGKQEGDVNRLRWQLTGRPMCKHLFFSY